MTALTFAKAIVPALWLAWAVYWFAAGTTAKPTRQREDDLSRASHVVPLAIAALLLTLPSVGWDVLDRRFLPASLLTYGIGAAVLAAGLAFTVWARVHIGANWSGVITIKRDHELVCSGPYRIVRHPIYAGLLIAFAGSAIARGEWRGLLALPFAFGALWRKLSIEERWLAATFGPAYATYRAEVPALVPFLV